MLLKKVLLCCLLVWCFVQVTAKPLDQCKSVFNASTKQKLCKANRYERIPGVDMDKTLDCVMRAANMVHKSGAGNFQALFKPMNAVEENGRKHNFSLESCMSKKLKEDLPQGKRAHAFYKCVMESESKAAFKKVFNQKVCQ
ncbi:37 kDa salivary gland allergen Aed a 2-like [Anopheles cruzii]|uniref:37 kDa salivary gland allergen Aed a 2-like n=1 Tax=Anopheles cruzii TaxID=68878 RepID=UPI0022EC334D|nr:37 kDa salivary gland allergen Aed a 2-like [Anopheles cruzii]